MSNKKKFVKVGTVMKNDKGQFVILGNSKSKDPKYQFTVEMTVKDATGKVLGKATNPFLNVQNPRKRPGITEEQAARIPENVLLELSLAVEE